MITDRRLPTHAVCLDLRDKSAEHAAGAAVGSAAAPDPLHSAVRRALDEAPPDERRFLVIDDAQRLPDHQLLYEQLFSYGPARTLCLAVGAPRSRTLSRPLSLSPPFAGVLWILDALGGSGSGDGQDVQDGQDVEASLRPLVELLAEPVVFDAVLLALGEIAAGVAVPAVHVLEHDLTDAARSRAWRQTLESLVGQDVPAPALVSAGRPAGRAGSEEAVPEALAPLLGDGIPKSAADRAWLLHGGRAEVHHRACGAALREVRSGYAYVRAWAGLFGSARRQPDVPGGLQELAAALGSYRDTVAGAFTDGDGVRLLPEQRSRLHKRGIDLPDIPEMSRENVGPGLRDYTERLIARRLPLRSVAARLGALADLTAPAGSASRLARLDEICPGEYLRHLETPLPFAVRAPRYAYALLAFLVAFVAGLWPGVGWVTGPLAGLAAGASAALMTRRRPNRTPDGRLDGGGRTHPGTRLLAGVAGGVGGALAGQALGLPGWAGPGALVVAVAALVVLTVQDWTAAVDAWWAETEAEHAAQVVSGTDALLAETAVHDWLFADARYHCSDGARAVSALLRSLAECAETYRGGDEPPGRSTTPESAPAPGGSGAGAGDAAADTWSWDNWGDSTDGADSADGDAWQAPSPAAPWNTPHSSSDPTLDELFAPAGAGAGAHDDRPREPSAPRDDPRSGKTGAGTGTGAAGTDPPWLRRETGDGGTALVTTLVGDLTDGVSDLLAPCWATVESDPSAAARTPLTRPMTVLLDEEHARLLRDAAATPPAYARDPENRPGAALLLGISTERVGQLLGPGSTAEQEAVRLCAAAHRLMLSQDPAAVRQVRFAPEAMRRGTERDADQDAWQGTGDDVVWAPNGRHAGVLRLVPLRSEIVRTFRSYEGPGAEGGAP